MGLMAPGNENILPRALSAKTLTGLERKIQALQFKEKAEFKFISFYFDPVKEMHIAWFYRELKTEEILTKEFENGRSIKSTSIS